VGYEATRADAAPDADALRLAEAHAREACHLDAGYAEAWATLGFVLARTSAGDAAAAAELVCAALRTAPAGNAGWLLPVDPLLRVHDAPSVWRPALSALRKRAV
jgi:hypothetical protein